MARKYNLDRLKHLNIDQAVIDRDAADILHSATQAVSKILTRRQEMDAQGLKDKPLVVVAGENHAMPSNYLHHILLLKKLRKAEPDTVFAYELRHRFDELFRPKLRKNFTALTMAEKSAWQSAAYIDLFNTHFSCASKKVLFNFNIRNKILFRPTDAAISRKAQLDPSDPSTKASIQACKPAKSFLSKVFNENSQIEALSVDGMYVRNHHMVKSSLAFAKETRARIVVQHCGNAHVGPLAGHLYFKKLPSDQGLSALFSQAGFKPFTIYPAAAADHNTDDLPERLARYDIYARRGEVDTDFATEAEEKIYIDAILAKTGLSSYRYNAQAKRDIRNIVDQFMVRP